MTVNDYLEHGINYEQLRIDMGLLISLIADDNMSGRVNKSCTRLFRVLTDLQQTVVENDLVNADIVYGKIPEDVK